MNYNDLKRLQMNQIPKKYKQIAELMEISDLRLLNVITEYTPHKYIITKDHKNFAIKHHYTRITDKVLRRADKYGVHCGLKGCTLPLAEHRMKKVALIHVVEGCTPEKASNDLKALIKHLIPHTDINEIQIVQIQMKDGNK